MSVGSIQDRHECDGFLLSIYDEPEDDTPRLVFSDWLEERGDEASQAWADLIRVQVERVRLKNRSPRRRGALEARAEALITTYQRHWLGDWADVPFRWVYHRGVPEAIEAWSQGRWIGERLGMHGGFPDRVRFHAAGRIQINHGDVNWSNFRRPDRVFDGRYRVRFFFTRPPAAEMELWQVERAALCFEGVMERQYGAVLLHLQERAVPGRTRQQVRLVLEAPR